MAVTGKAKQNAHILAATFLIALAMALMSTGGSLRIGLAVLAIAGAVRLVVTAPRVTGGWGG